jgi:DNA-binding NarL/FixJ family response regulator
MSPPIRVLIVDDDESLLRMLHVILSLEEDIDVVGLAENAVSALALATAARPDVVVLDNQMPGRSGVDVLPDLIAAGVRSVIMHTAHATFADQETARRLGAAIIAKGADITGLLNAIRATQHSD